MSVAKNRFNKHVERDVCNDFLGFNFMMEQCLIFGVRCIKDAPSHDPVHWRVMQLTVRHMDELLAFHFHLRTPPDLSTITRAAVCFQTAKTGARLMVMWTNLLTEVFVWGTSNFDLFQNGIDLSMKQSTGLPRSKIRWAGL